MSELSHRAGEVAQEKTFAFSTQSCHEPLTPQEGGATNVLLCSGTTAIKELCKNMKDTLKDPSSLRNQQSYEIYKIPAS